MVNRFLQISQPDLTELEENAVLEVMRSGWIGYGTKAQEFEKEFSKHVSNYHCLAVNSCTTGLILALKVLGIGPGDNVITTPLTFAATINAIISVGAKPYFVDVTREGSIDPHELEFAFNIEPKAVIPVHLWGKPCDMADIEKICKQRNWKIIEDAAHGFGGDFYETPLGTMGDIGIFSFYPTKNITTIDGGIVVCKDTVKAQKMRVMASQGLTIDAWKRYGNSKIRDYHIVTPGIKGLMPDVNAAIGLSQLKRWNEIKQRRSEIWRVYEQAFGKKGTGHSQHLYTIQVKNRTAFRANLHEKGVGTGIHYNPLHLEPAYRYLGYKTGDFPMAEKIGAETVSLPISSKMTVEEADYIVDVVKANL